MCQPLQYVRTLSRRLKNSNRYTGSPKSSAVMTSNKDVYANLKQRDYQFAVDVDKRSEVGENEQQFDHEYEQFEMSSAKSK